MITRILSAGMMGVSAAGFRLAWQSHKYRAAVLPPVRLGMIGAAVVPPVLLIMAMGRAEAGESLLNSSEISVGMTLGLSSVAVDYAGQLLGAAVVGEL